MLFAAVHESALALSGQFDCASFCPLLGNSGQRWMLGRDGLSAYDPTATFGAIDTPHY